MVDRGGYNFQSDSIENGTFNGFASLFTHILPILRYLWFNLKNPFKSRYTDKFSQKREELNLSESTLYGLNRTITEILIVGILATIQTLWHNKMIDSGNDDDYVYNAIDHILLRIAIERMTFLNPDTLLDLVNSVTASKSDIDRKFKLLDLIADVKKGYSDHGWNFEEWDEVKQGAFQHKPKALKELL
jgi:hypothetical protein